MNKIIFYSIFLCSSFITVVNAMESGSVVEFNLGKPDICNPKASVKLSLMDDSIHKEKYDGKVTFVMKDDNCLMNVYLSKSLKLDSEDYEAYSHVDKLNNASSKRLVEELQRRVSPLNCTCVWLSINGSLGDSELTREVIVEVDTQSVKQLLLACGVDSSDKKDSIFREDSFSCDSFSESDSENGWFSSYKWPVGILSASMIVVLCLYFFQFRK
jgi:hypothetical protein